MRYLLETGRLGAEQEDSGWKGIKAAERRRGVGQDERRREQRQLSCVPACEHLLCPCIKVTDLRPLMASQPLLSVYICADVHALDASNCYRNLYNYLFTRIRMPPPRCRQRTQARPTCSTCPSCPCTATSGSGRTSRCENVWGAAPGMYQAGRAAFREQCILELRGAPRGRVGPAPSISVLRWYQHSPAVFWSCAIRCGR